MTKKDKEVNKKFIIDSPLVGELYKVKKEITCFGYQKGYSINGIYEITVQPDEFLVLTKFYPFAPVVSFSSDYSTPTNWICTFLYNDKLIHCSFKNSNHSCKFFEYLEHVITCDE